MKGKENGGLGGAKGLAPPNLTVSICATAQARQFLKSWETRGGGGYTVKQVLPEWGMVMFPSRTASCTRSYGEIFLPFPQWNTLLLQHLPIRAGMLGISLGTQRPQG